MWTNNGTQVVVEASLVTSQNVKLIVGRANRSGKWCKKINGMTREQSLLEANLTQEQEEESPCALR